MSVSRTHNLKNVRREREESIADLRRIVEARNALPEGKRPSIVGGLSTAPHFHDTRGTGLANVASALEVGVRRFEHVLDMPRSY